MFGTNFKPVCGSDGKTYSNFAILKAYSCMANIKITKAHDGPCGNIQYFVFSFLIFSFSAAYLEELKINVGAQKELKKSLSNEN